MAAGERGSVSLAIEETGRARCRISTKTLQVWITQAAVRGGSSERGREGKFPLSLPAEPVPSLFGVRRYNYC